MGGIRSTGLTASLGIGKLAARLCGDALLGDVPHHPDPTSLRWTPLPSVEEIVASFRNRGDGSVVFSNTPEFGAHYVTHPLTRMGFSRASERHL